MPHRDSSTDFHLWLTASTDLPRLGKEPALGTHGREDKASLHCTARPELGPTLYLSSGSLVQPVSAAELRKKDTHTRSFQRVVSVAGEKNQKQAIQPEVPSTLKTNPLPTKHSIKPQNGLGCNRS